MLRRFLSVRPSWECVVSGQQAAEQSLPAVRISRWVWKKWDYFCEEWCCCCRFRQTALVTPKRLLVLLEEVRKEVVSFSTNCGSLKKRHLLANTEIKQNNNSSFSENKSFQLFFGYTWNDATMTLLGGGLSRFGKSLNSLEIIFRIVGKIMNVFGEFWRF